MAVPPHYVFMRPALELFADNKSRKTNDVVTAMIAQFRLSDAEVEELLPSGGTRLVHNRVSWAMTHLRKAKLLEYEKAGVTRITERGRVYLKSCPEIIKRDDLKQFPEFVDFLQTKKRPSGGDDAAPTHHAAVAILVTGEVTPDEAIRAAYTALNDALAQELLDSLKVLSPARFERLIVQLMLRLGYGGTADDAGQTLGKGGDGGVDGVISQDKLGLEKIYLQAKRWTDGTVGRPEIQRFVGALSGQHATKGVFITTSAFSQEAREFARSVPNFKISLVDGVELARLMVEHNLGVALFERFEVKRVDKDFFSEE